MTGKQELEGMCDQMDGEWLEPGDPNPDYPEEELESGVYICDMGRSSFTLFEASGQQDRAGDEVVVREHDGRDNVFHDIDPYQLQVQGSELTVNNVRGTYYDGFTNNRIDNGTIRIFSYDGAMEVEQTVTY